MLRVYAPPLSARSFIEAIWVLDPASAARQTSNAVLLNEGIVELAVQCIDGPRRTRRPAKVPRAKVSGFMTRPHRVRKFGRSRTIGIRFRPGALACLADISCQSFTDRIVDASDVVDRLNLTAVLLALREKPERTLVAGLRCALVKLTAHSENVGALALKELCDSSNEDQDFSIRRFCCANAVSVRQFERQCLDWVGVSPKRFLRVQRFKQVLRAASLGERPVWADVASRFGFSDQAHLCREFKEFMGEAPNLWWKRLFGSSIQIGSTMDSAPPDLTLAGGSNWILGGWATDDAKFID